MVFVPRAIGEDFDYQAEADKTCSIHWNPQHVDLADLRANVEKFVELAGVMNLYKKLLFRGKTPAELMLRTPGHGESLASHGGIIPFNEVDLVHGIIGSMTESGELAEVLLNMLDGKSPDRVNVVEEVGDNRWYLNRCLRWADVTDLQCERANIDKLHGRGHANGLDIFADANRDLEGERARLEAATDAAIAADAPTLPLRQHDNGLARRPIGGCEGMDC